MYVQICIRNVNWSSKTWCMCAQDSFLRLFEFVVMAFRNISFSLRPRSVSLRPGISHISFVSFLCNALSWPLSRLHVCLSPLISIRWLLLPLYSSSSMASAKPLYARISLVAFFRHSGRCYSEFLRACLRSRIGYWCAVHPIRDQS